MRCFSLFMWCVREMGKRAFEGIRPEFLFSGSEMGSLGTGKRVEGCCSLGAKGCHIYEGKHPFPPSQTPIEDLMQHMLAEHPQNLKVILSASIPKMLPCFQKSSFSAEGGIRSKSPLTSLAPHARLYLPFTGRKNPTTSPRSTLEGLPTSPYAHYLATSPRVLTHPPPYAHKFSSPSAFFILYSRFPAYPTLMRTSFLPRLHS